MSKIKDIVPILLTFIPEANATPYILEAKIFPINRDVIRSPDAIPLSSTRQSISDDVLHFALAYNAGGMWNMLMQWIDKREANSYNDLLKAFNEISIFNLSRIHD